MEQRTILLKVNAETSRDANILVTDLITELTRNVREIKLERQKENPETLDPGTAIVAILGTQFALELARTLRAWLMRNQGATLSIGKDGEIQTTGISAADVEKIVLEWLRARNNVQ